ncbi:oxygenase MpaB family protein [Actinocorallia populi]|uniref:oxygenase MpaB family protein n=1 Tax=Actinocorallia populi TaxID=2079200 RepID=UPI000D096A85|nr:oxygenase MpaB family protein [Actinocorallia populi]
MDGSGSLLRRYAGDFRALIPGSSAGLMQLLYPPLGAGVADHSDFFSDPFGRIYRSVPQIWATIFESDAAARARGVRDLHAGMKGVERGRRYHALEPETFWWAHATFTWEIFRSVELFHPQALSADEEERLYAETVQWYERYGMSMKPVPQDYAAFRTKFHRICAEELDHNPAADRALDIALHGRGVSVLPDAPALIGRAASLMAEPSARSSALGCLPEIVRERFGIPWSATDRLVFAVRCQAICRGWEAVPDRVNRTALRTLLRYVGSTTRDRRYRPAA